MNNQHNNLSLANCPACQTAVSRQAVSCPKCGQPLQATSYQQPQFQQNFPQPVPKKGGIGKTFGIGCLGIIGFFVVAGLIGSIAIPKRNDVQNQSNTAASPTPATPAAKFAEGKRLVEANEYVGDLEKGITLLEQIDSSAPEYKAAQPILKKAKVQVEKEAKDTAIRGTAPQSSGWDSSVREVDKFLRKTAKDPDSLTYQEWSKVYGLNYDGGVYWAVDVTYRAKNSFGGMVLESKTFLIRHNQIIKMIDK